MPRKPLILTDSAPYHITNRSNNQEFFDVPPERLWPIFMETLDDTKKMFRCNLHAFLLMSNHYHWLASFPELNIGPATRYLQTEVARKANRVSGRKNHLFAGRYKWSLIHDESYYWNSVKYVFRNPVRAGICEKVEDFQFSSLNRESGLFEWQMTDFFVDNSKIVNLDLEWLNEPFLTEQEQGIRSALRRREFQLPKAKDGKIVQIFPMPIKKLVGV